MSVIIVNPITADSLRSALPDSIWIANFPEPSFAATLVPWITPIVSAGLAAAATFLLTRHMYNRQKLDAQRAKDQAAYGLLWAICDEMQRTRQRILDILKHASKGQSIRGPILTEARDKLLGRLAESMPTGWEPHHVFRFYELLSLVAIHHNAAVEIPEVSGEDALISVMARRTLFGLPKDAASDDLRRQRAYHRTCVAFACHYFDPEDDDSITGHYIAAVRQLRELGLRVQMPVDERIVEPTETERAGAKQLIADLTAPAHGKNLPDPSRAIRGGQIPMDPE